VGGLGRKDRVGGILPVIGASQFATITASGTWFLIGLRLWM
jgi:hypothetical protein